MAWFWKKVWCGTDMHTYGQFVWLWWSLPAVCGSAKWINFCRLWFCNFVQTLGFDDDWTSVKGWEMKYENTFRWEKWWDTTCHQHDITNSHKIYLSTIFQVILIPKLHNWNKLFNSNNFHSLPFNRIFQICGIRFLESYEIHGYKTITLRFQTCQNAR